MSSGDFSKVSLSNSIPYWMDYYYKKFSRVSPSCISTTTRKLSLSLSHHLPKPFNIVNNLQMMAKPTTIVQLLIERLLYQTNYDGILYALLPLNCFISLYIYICVEFRFFSCYFSPRQNINSKWRRELTWRKSVTWERTERLRKKNTGLKMCLAP